MITVLNFFGFFFFSFFLIDVTNDPLNLLFEAKTERVIDLLIKKGLNPNKCITKDNVRITPLSQAIKSKSKLAFSLISHGACFTEVETSVFSVTSLILF